MKKIWAVINLNAEETAQNLLACLFSKEDFNPNNAILIEDKVVLLEVFFEETAPQKIAETIGGYHNIRCGFGELSEELLKNARKSFEDVYHQKAHEGNEHAEVKIQEVYDSSENEAVLSSEVVSKPNEESVSDAEVEGENKEPSSEELAYKAEGKLFHDESNNGSSEEEPCVEPTATTEESPAEEVSEGAPSAVTVVKSGRRKPRKAPEQISQIDAIARKCVSYEQFTSEVAKWVEVGNRESYLIDLFQVATVVEKLSWTPIEKELAKKGYNNPFAMRQRTSMEVTKKFTQENIECSFIALVEYVIKFKNYDFRPNIEAKVNQILNEMGIENEKTELQSVIIQIAISAVMVEEEKANMKDICTAAGYGEDEDTILDVKMNFSNFVNKFLKKRGLESIKAEVFVARLREAVYNGTSIC